MQKTTVSEKDKKVIAGIKTGETAITGPYGVQIGVTGDCNFRCRFCAFFSDANKQEQVKNEQKRISFNRFSKLTGTLKEMDVAQVSLVGWGEPLVHPDIIQMISCVKEHGLKCMLTSNASLLTEDKISKLVDSGLDMFNVSLNAGTRASYKNVHGINGNSKFSFGKVLDSLKIIAKVKRELKCDKPVVSIRSVICKDTYKDIVNIFNIAKDLGIHSVTLQEWACFDSSEEIGLKEPEILSLLSDLELIEKNQGINIVNNIDYFKNRLKSILSKEKDVVIKSMECPCYVGWTYSMIMHNGDVLPCCNCTRPMGNIYEQDFDIIWNGEKYKKFRKDTLNIDTVPFNDDKCLCYVTCGSVEHNRRMRSMIIQEKLIS